MGAGILPVSFHKNTLYFLFGEEENERKWSDFGGGKNNNETPLQTAIREGYEETNGILGTMSDIKDILKHNTLLKIGIEQYTSFIVKVGYDERLPYYLINKNGFFEKRQMKWMTINDMKTKRKYFRGHYKSILDHIIKNERYLLQRIYEK